MKIKFIEGCVDCEKKKREKITDKQRLDWILKPGVCVSGSSGKVMFTRRDIDAAIRAEAKSRRKR